MFLRTALIATLLISPLLAQGKSPTASESAAALVTNGVAVYAPLTNPTQYFWIGAIAGGNCMNWSTGNTSYPLRGRSFDAENWDQADTNDGFVTCNDTGTRLACFQR